jgi:protein SCO1
MKKARRSSKLSSSILNLCLLSILCGLVSCSSPTNESKQSRRYDLSGKILSVDKEHSQVTIAHEEIKGLMPAMTMPFFVKDKSTLNDMAPGDEIKATLVYDLGRSWIENPAITKLKSSSNNPNPTNVKEAAPMDEVPDLSFVNQDEKSVNLKQYRGRAVLLTFIYTRCPIPDYCILMSNNFAEIHRQIQGDSSLAAKTHLLSISIDPSYDTPKVLRSYGERYLKDSSKDRFKSWEFLSGSNEEVARAAQFFGLTYGPEGNQIVHSLRTAIIDPQGKVFKVYKGNEWKPSEVVEDLKSLLKAT